MTRERRTGVKTAKAILLICWQHPRTAARAHQPLICLFLLPILPHLYPNTAPSSCPPPYTFISYGSFYCWSLVFTPCYYFLYLYLFASISPPLPFPVVQFSMVSLTVLMGLSHSSAVPLIPSLSSLLPPSLPHARTHFIYPSLHPSFIIHESASEKERERKRTKMHLQLGEDSFTGVSVWQPMARTFRLMMLLREESKI